MPRIKIGSTRTVREYVRGFDKWLLLLVVLALVVGFLAINSATVASDQHARYLYRQGVAAVIGLAGFFFFSMVDYNFLSSLSVFFALGSFAVMTFTAIFGNTIDGNTNWITLGSFNLQPSEIAKICFILSMSGHLSRLGRELNRPRNMLQVLIHFLCYAVPLVLQGDIGTLIVYVVMFAVMLLCADIKLTYVVIGLAAVAAAVPIGWRFLKDYHKKRIIYGFRPELDPLDTGYQPLTSRMAIGSGRLFGLGYMSGIQAQNAMLPAIQTDFIYAIIGEEMGFVGALFVLLLLLAIVFLCYRDARKAKDNCGFLICVAVGTMLLCQTLINIGMCIGVSPVIGITLPFISYGGSSVISVICCIGLVMSVCVKPDSALRFDSQLS